MGYGIRMLWIDEGRFFEYFGVGYKIRFKRIVVCLSFDRKGCKRFGYYFSLC